MQFPFQTIGFRAQILVTFGTILRLRLGVQREIAFRKF